MLHKRIIVCLDVQDGRALRRPDLREGRDLGDAAELALRFEREGADEIVFLDSSQAEGRGLLVDLVRRTAERLFIPLTIGGSITTAADVGEALRAGADKVSINTAAIERPELVAEVASAWGAQALVIAIDAKRSGAGWRVYTHGGRHETELDAVEWARRASELGAGEILLTSMDRDGTKIGYDVALLRSVVDAVSVPVIASGGVGTLEHLREGLAEGGADAALAASIFHDRIHTIAEARRFLAAHGVAVRGGEP
jgi:cyclase